MTWRSIARLTTATALLVLELALVTEISAQSPPLPLPLRRLPQPCGSDARGVLACPVGEFCERLNAFYYVCRPRLHGMRGEPLVGVDIIPRLPGEVPIMGFNRDRLCTLPTCVMMCFEIPSCVAVVFYSYDSARRPDVPFIQCKIVLEGDDTTETPRAVREATSVYIDRDAPCPAESRSVCGSESWTTSCCPRGEHCVVEGRVRRCTPTSPQCTAPRFGTPFFREEDLIAFGLDQSECCELCATTPGCTTYRYDGPEQGECMLLSFSGPPRYSTYRMFASPVNPLPPCENEKGGACGDSERGATCCPPSDYCQPLSSTKFQCVERPPKCSKQVPQTALKATEEEPTVVTVTKAADCCDACKKSTTCKAYTYIHDAPRGPLCKLFAKTATERTYHPTAVTGYLNSMYA